MGRNSFFRPAFNANTLVFAALFWLVGLSSWITITGLYNELVIMSDHLSEGFEIWSILTLIIQSASAAPVLYYVCVPNACRTSRFVFVVGCCILSLSFLSMLLMSFYWNETIHIGSSASSLVLYILTFCASLSSAMASIIFWIFVSRYSAKYIALLSAGESAAGIVCSVLIWIQQSNVAHNTHSHAIKGDYIRYSIEVYFIALAFLLPLSSTAFMILMHLLSNQNYFSMESDLMAKIYPTPSPSPTPTKTAKESDLGDKHSNSGGSGHHRRKKDQRTKRAKRASQSSLSKPVMVTVNLNLGHQRPLLEGHPIHISNDNVLNINSNSNQDSLPPQTSSSTKYRLTTTPTDKAVSSLSANENASVNNSGHNSGGSTLGAKMIIRGRIKHLSTATKAKANANANESAYHHSRVLSIPTHIHKSSNNKQVTSLLNNNRYSLNETKEIKITASSMSASSQLHISNEFIMNTMHDVEPPAMKPEIDEEAEEAAEQEQHHSQLLLQPQPQPQPPQSRLTRTLRNTVPMPGKSTITTTSITAPSERFYAHPNRKKKYSLSTTQHDSGAGGYLHPPNPSEAMMGHSLTSVHYTDCDLSSGPNSVLSKFYTANPFVSGYCFCCDLRFVRFAKKGRCCLRCLCINDEHAIASKNRLRMETIFLARLGISRYEYSNWIVLLGLICAVQNGMIPSISAYVLISYHKMVYVYALTISSCISPLMAVLPALFHHSYCVNAYCIALECVCWMFCSLYLLWIALLSPHPIGQNASESQQSTNKNRLIAVKSNNGSLWIGVVILVYVCCQSLLTISKTSVIMLINKLFIRQSRALKRRTNKHIHVLLDRQINKIMERIAGGMQVGSFLGALLFFLLVNVAHIFS